MAKEEKQNNIAVTKSTHEVLQQAGFQPQQSLSKRKVLSTSEEGKRYLLDVAGVKDSVLYQVDGVIIKEGGKCDKLILVHTGDDGAKEQWTEIFVELKGTDVRHALEQLIASAKNPIFKHGSNTERRARVVATNFPANNANPDVEKLKKQLATMKIKYKQFKNGQRDCI